MTLAAQPKSPLQIVVVAEDDELIRMAVVDALNDAGFAVVEAGHAADALAILAREADSVQALFTDIHMPGSMDGLELGHHVQSHWPWIAVLVASGKARPSPSDMPTGSRFVEKPYRLSDVVGHLNAMVSPNG